MARRDGRAAPDGRVLSYPLIPAEPATTTGRIHDALIERARDMVSWSPGEVVVKTHSRTANGYIIGTVEMNAPPIGGVPIPKAPARRRRKRVKGERA